jgi:paraquat-inducible protein A
LLLQTKPVNENASSLIGRRLFIVLAIVYAVTAIVSAWNVIAHTQNSTAAIEHILSNYDMKNEGSIAVDRYTQEHPILGTLFGGPVRQELELPSKQEAEDALHSQIRHLLNTVRDEAGVAAWWSWLLLNVSLAYVVATIALTRSFFTRATLFALNSAALVCFVVGIFAPAMVIWTAPSVPMESGQLSFVLQHQVRGIASIIWELLTTGHWIVGGFLLLFSVITPLTKSSLTYFVIASRSKELNFKIGELLHSIGKWSMADVFVAGVLLSMFALKAQEATKSIPCLGLYYFIGYCLLSMTTTELLTRSHLTARTGKEQKSDQKIGRPMLSALFAVLVGFIAISSVYTFQQYTLNMRKDVLAPSSPQQLDNANLVLPAHK